MGTLDPEQQKEPRYQVTYHMYLASSPLFHIGSDSSGVATPGHTRAYAHVKFTGARVKKAKVKDQVLACAIESFMWT